MITNIEQKLIQGLGLKKNRKAHQLFVVEGIKNVSAYLDEGYVPTHLFSTENIDKIDSIHLSIKEMNRISQLKSPSPLLATFSPAIHSNLPDKGRLIGLDQVRDPGNLGTIIRLCDWYGINHIICSNDTVDCYNPKVVQAAMGSLARVRCHYTELNDYIKTYDAQVYGTLLEGNSIYETKFSSDTLLIFGSEAHGISPEITNLIQHRITIPKKSENGPESLNVSIAAGIILSEMCR